MKKTPVTDAYRDCRDLLSQGQNDKARDKADEGIVWLADTVTKQHLKDTDLIEGVRVSLWYDRFWLFLELNGLLLDKDEDHKPEANYFWDKLQGVEL
jgi:hypothetical protein